jgi:hypothetical protein
VFAVKAVVPSLPVFTERDAADPQVAQVAA